jgi:4-amino-4-deoxy-L-arabinose transferase-like glycosyltransferase
MRYSIDCGPHIRECFARRNPGPLAPDRTSASSGKESNVNVSNRQDSNTVARNLFIVGLVALAAALLMVLIVFKAQRLVANAGDPYDYGKIARGFVEHGFTTLTRRAASLYPELIAVVYRSGGSNFTVELLQTIFHAGTCLLVVALGTSLYNPRTGLLAGLLCALHPMLLRYVGDLHMETMLTFLCTLTVWCAVRFYYQRTIQNGILLGAVGMITTLTKGVILPYVVVFAAICFALAVRERSGRAMIAAVAVGVTMALILAPWTYRNYTVTGGRFVLLTPGTSDSFLRGYIFTRLEFATLQKPPYTDAENESNDWFRRIARDAGTEWLLDEVVDEANNARVAKRMIFEQPLETVRKCVVGLFTFWYEMTSLKNSLVPALLALAAWTLAAVGLKRAVYEGRPAWLLLLPILVMNVFVAVLIPLGRYSVPILPCLMILAAYGIDTLLPERS